MSDRAILSFPASLMQGRRAAWWPVAVIVLLLVATVGLRLPELRMPGGAPNLEAPWHVLLTTRAIAENPVSEHWLLPIVTLGNPADKGVPWGATVPTANGNFVYASFSALGFLAPYLFFQATGLPPGLGTLAAFNMLLQLACCLLLYGFLRRAVRMAGISAEPARGAALLGIVPAVFSREALLSQGLIYWHQSLYQLLLIATLLTLSVVLDDTRVQRRWARPLLLVLCFLGAWVEWSGFVTNAALVVLLWLQGGRRLAIGVVLASGLAGLAFLLHLLTALGLDQAILALGRRFLARGTHQGSLRELAFGYWTSYGLFLPVLAGAAILLAVRGVSRCWPILPLRPVPLLMLAAAAPLAENLLMLQHATQFSFDRLKLLPFAGLVIALAMAQVGQRVRLATAVLLALAAVGGMVGYRNSLVPFAAWAGIDQANHRLRDDIAQRVDLDCAVLESSGRSRAYDTLLFGRNILEFQKPASLEAVLRQKAACAAVFLSNEEPFTDLSRFTGAIILWPNGTRESIGSP